MPTEFFTTESDLTHDRVMAVTSHNYTGLQQMPASEIIRIINTLKVSDQAMRCIASMGKYEINTMNDKLVRFIRCNFAELNHVDDITDDNMLNFEYVNCGFKGNNHCPWAKSFCVIKTKVGHGPRC